MNKNNFKHSNFKENVKYKLFVAFKEPFRLLRKANEQTGRKVYYGFMSKPDKGLQSLRKLVKKLNNEYEIAIIYDNGVEMERYN